MLREVQGIELKSMDWELRGSWDVVLYADGALMWSWSICARD